MNFWEELRERLCGTSTEDLLRELQEIEQELKLDKFCPSQHLEAETREVREVLLVRAYPELEEEEGRRHEDDPTR